MNSDHHGYERLAANDSAPLLAGEQWDELVNLVVSDELETPFHRDTRAHWEVTGPQPVDETFGVICCVSGGMDSATLMRQAVDCSIPVEPVFFDLGQAYTAHELQALDRRRQDFVVHSEPREWIEHEGIMIGRNTMIALRAAQRLAEQGKWGEVWIGATAGENDWRGGDKSPRWLNDINALLSRAHVDVRIVAPLHYLDKSDQVALAARQGWVEELAATKSCHRGDVWACGACRTCFRKFAAFNAYGYGPTLVAHHEAPLSALAPVAREYEPWIERPGSKYGLRRRETTRLAMKTVLETV